MTAYMHPVVARGSSAVFEKLTIGKLASATGMKVETIRYYEQIGLLPAPTRSAANYRTYEQEHLRRLSFIRRARDLGFSIDQVRELMGLADRRDQSHFLEPGREAGDRTRAGLDRFGELLAADPDGPV